jgi:hypothetical protein
MNHLVTGNTAMSAAFAEATGKTSNVFEFNLVDQILAVHSSGLKQQVMSSLAFACDAYINNTLKGVLADFYRHANLEGNAPWDTYQTFLNHVAGLVTSQETMSEAGMEVTDTRARLQSLFNLRTELHAKLLDMLGSSYEVPSLEDFMLNPRLGRDDANTLAKAEANAREFATDDDGVIDLDLFRAHMGAAKVRSEAERNEALKWEKRRGEITAVMYRAFKLRDDMADASLVEYGTFDPFGDLDAELQYKLMHGTLRYVDNVLDRASRDRKIPLNEYTTWLVEARPLRKAIKAAVEHPKFANIGV